MSKTILVTGANSFIGTWIVRYLAEKGYNVRGTVRSKEKEANVLDGVPKELHGQISFVHVVDISNDSFDEAVKDVDGIIHVASPFHFNVNDPEKDMLIPAINGTLGVMKAAHAYNQTNGNKITRIIITSSFAAILDPTQGLRPGYHYSEKDWCPFTYEQGVGWKNEPVQVYRTSKVCAERAAWDFLEKEKPSFTIATICPPLVFGPRADGFKSLQDMNTSNGTVWTLINSGKDAKTPGTSVPIFIDVRDVANIHVAALEKGVETSERYFTSGGIWSSQMIADIIHESEVISETIKSSTPIGVPHQQLPDHFQADCSKVKTQLGIEFTSLKTSIEDLVSQFEKLKQTLE